LAIKDLQADKEVPIGNLKSGTLYYLQVAAVNQYGTGPKTARISAETVYVPTTQGALQTTRLPDIIATKIESNDVDSKLPLNEKVSSAKSPKCNHRTLQFLFWTLITLILLVR